MQTSSFLEKVTAFITRNHPNSSDLLLFRHPTAGIQIPAGTVEPDETPEQAVFREAFEETGLDNLQIVRYLGALEEPRPEGIWIIRHKTKVYSRAKPDSFNWAEFRTGLQVQELRQEASFVQVTFQEWDRYPDPQYLTYQITGWVPQSCLCRGTLRHFYHLSFQDPELPDHWLHKDEFHLFELFWSSLNLLPEIVAPQQKWLNYVKDHLGYGFQ